MAGMQLNEILEPLLKMDSKSLIGLSAECYGRLLPLLSEIDTEYGGMSLVITILSAAVNADGEISEEEYLFFKGFTLAFGQSMTRDGITDLIRNYSGKEAAEIVKALASVCTAEQGSDLAFLVACICAIDRKISTEEYQLIVDLLDQ